MSRKRPRSSYDDDSLLYKIQPIAIQHKPEDDKPVKGAAVIEDLHANIFLCAKTNSGKTTIIAHLLQHTIDERTHVFLFCATLNSDPAWEAITADLDRRGITYSAFPSIYAGKTNVLLTLMHELVDADIERKQQEELMRQHQNDSGKVYILKPPNAIFEAIKRERELERTKYTRVPRRLIIMDDLSVAELRNRSVDTLVKKNRHLGIRTIISSQHIIHLAPSAFSQLHCVMLFGGFSRTYMSKIHDRLGTPVDEKEFFLLYQVITKPPHSFLTLYMRTGTFRDNLYPPSIRFDEIFGSDTKV